MREDSVQVKAFLERAHMELGGWASSNKHYGRETHVEEPVEISILWMIWNHESDTLSLKPLKGKGVINSNWVATKHKILSLIVSNFKPLGLVAPIFAKGKIFLQVLQEKKVGWDNVLTTERAAEEREIP